MPGINFEAKTDRELLLQIAQTVNTLCDKHEVTVGRVEWLDSVVHKHESKWLVLEAREQSGLPLTNGRIWGPKAIGILVGGIAAGVSITVQVASRLLGS